MMKRMFCLLLTVLMGVSCIFASAEDAQDNSADALTLAELQAFAARMQTLAMASTPLNDPADAKTEDGYAFEYSFGTIYADSPAMSIDTQLLSIVLTSAEEQGPRDIQVGDELSIVLEANYSENPSLRQPRIRRAVCAGLAAGKHEMGRSEARRPARADGGIRRA